MMSSSALITMLVVQFLVTAISIIFLAKVIRKRNGSRDNGN